MTFPFTIVGEHGKVLSTGTGSMLPPELPGTIVLQRIAPPDCYWDGADFVPIGSPGGMHETYDWATHTWADRRTLDDHKRSLTLLATARRYQAEVAGIALPDGMQVKTAPEDYARITRVLRSPVRPKDALIDFKSASGWKTLTAADLEAVVAAIDLYVQECFSAERAHHEAIAALPSVEAAEAYDINLNWPSRQR